MSMDHLATTPSLVTRLDSEGYLSLSYLMSLSSISKTGISRSELIDVIRTIPTLSLSPTLTGVRVSIPVARKTVILRDLPADTTEDMVRSLFEGVTIESIKEEISNSWFVTFSTEEEALSSLNSLQTRTFAGAPIKARMKSEYYLATVVNAYRRILDGGDVQALQEELSCAAHRDYTTAYMLGDNRRTVSYDNSQTKGMCEFIAVVKGYEGPENGPDEPPARYGRVYAEMRTRFYEGDVLEILSPSDAFGKQIIVSDMKDSAGTPCADAKRVQEIVSFACPYVLHAGDILRRRR